MSLLIPRFVDMLRQLGWSTTIRQTPSPPNTQRRAMSGTNIHVRNIERESKLKFEDLARICSTSVSTPLLVISPRELLWHDIALFQVSKGQNFEL